MQQKNNTPSFFDPKTLIAVAAVAIVYYGWNTYLGKKYPDYNKPKTQTEQAKNSATAATTSETPAATANTVDTKSEIMETPTTAKEFHFENDKVSFVMTSFGMGLKGYTINNYQDKEKNNIKLGVSNVDGLFEMRWAGDSKPLTFDVAEQAPGHYVGTAHVGETVIKRELKFNTETSSFTNTISVSNPTEDFKKGFSLLIPESIHTHASTSFLFPSYEHQDFFVTHNGGKHDTVNFSGAKEDVVKDFPATSLVSVSSQYFAAAILDKSEIMPEVKLNAQINAKTAMAELVYKPASVKSEMTFSEVFYAGPKSIDALKAVDPEMASLIDFGFFGFIARPLLYVMKAAHSVVGNWGFAIIILTLLVRLCVLPFNIMSFKSMKAMQKVQPIIQNLREKYKEDPMRLNQEMMAVMKQNGANPLGGCLPMLLQIPVFFALYRVIGSSIELYNSPFIFWITDLSSHDKFYVLPVSMAVFMFIQQKITPSTMDPTQAKIMAFLPVVFSLFMLQLPAGLTLYMVVSTLFGIIQQWLIMREPKTKAVTA
ncbi:membrane protein insertase YidC [Bdellovibrio bacteriovorus]|uniref:Membrane protein insertase YidC n=1 Tax=Bdellovibrio bacteriovorus str. Tiberius TaxID=1069642 RepID=K7YU99_BDEBC|nr:membrane protein insertase YidC [Bdellovibrio bacteriovorus]AFY03451.1 60 KD inner-membrane protein [Bdellovibrio bacteriovorus str. Tiberius]